MKNLFWTLFLALPTFSWAQDCAPFSSPADGKAIKVTFYTETDQCFTLSKGSGTVNTSPSKRVVFYMDLGTEKTQVKLANGTALSKSVAVTNAAMASMVYEVVFNEKKAEWDIKNRLGQADVTEAQHQKQDEDFNKLVADQKAKKEADDKAWDDKMAAEKAERERIAAEEKAKEGDKPRYTLSPYEDTRQGIQGRTDLPAEPRQGIQGRTDLPPTNSGSSGGSSTLGSGSNTKPVEEPKKEVPSELQGTGNGDGSYVTKGSHMQEFVVMYKDAPVTNTFFSIGYKDYNFGTCLTDSNGYCKLYSETPIDCNGPIDLKGQRSSSGGGDNASVSASAKWTIGGFFIVNCGTPTKFTLERATKYMAEMMGGTEEDLARSWGLMK